MSPISVHRVYWYTDWVHGVKAALKELWRSLFGCHHRWDTRSFRHTEHGAIAVNVCSKCGKRHPFFSWDGKYW